MYNTDGSVKLQGTAETSSNFGVGEIYLSEGVYFSCDFASGNFPDNAQARVQVYSSSNSKSIATLNNSPRDYVGGGESGFTATWYQCRIRIDAGYTYDCTLFPTLVKGERPTEYVPYVSDLTAITVKKYEKNLFKTVPNTIDGVTLTQKEDYLILNGVATASNNFVVSIGYLPSGYYALSANNPINNGLELSLIDVFSPDPYCILAVWDNKNYGKVIALLSESNEYLCRIRIEKGVKYDNFVLKPQLEYCDNTTEYEKYKTVEEFTPSADGTVEGITSLAPTMTLLTDTANTVIECEYNRDINVALADILAKISN